MWPAGSTSEAADTPCRTALRYGLRLGVGVTDSFLRKNPLRGRTGSDIDKMMQTASRFGLRARISDVGILHLLGDSRYV